MKAVDLSNGKEPAHAATKTKRTHKGGEVELAKKRTSQVLRLANYIELRDVAPATAQALRRASLPLINLQLSNSKVGRLFCKAVLNRAMDLNLS